MNNITKILAFISLVTMVFMFTGAASAANYAGSLGSSIQANIINTPNNTIIVNDNSNTTYKNVELNNPLLKSKRKNTIFRL
ncbi:hypothetical protein [Methanobacterium sp.]|uniref:hypothetical protein n=1 Tax=Methanobacterium sp. TaxID=2164 RepID=UPI003C72FD55